MAVTTLTDESVAAIPSPTDKPQSYHWDAVVPGFGVVIGKTGRRTFVVRGRVDGSLKKQTIGAAGEPMDGGGVWCVSSAREAAAVILRDPKRKTARRVTSSRTCLYPGVHRDDCGCGGTISAYGKIANLRLTAVFENGVERELRRFDTHDADLIGFESEHDDYIVIVTRIPRAQMAADDAPITNTEGLPF